MAQYMGSGARYLTVSLCPSPYQCMTATSHVFSVCLCFSVCQMGILKHLRHRVSCVKMKRAHVSQVLEAFISAYSSFSQLMASHHSLCFIPLPSLSPCQRSHTSLVIVSRVIDGDGSVAIPLLFFPDSHSVPAAQGCRACASCTPAGETARGPSSHTGHPLHLCVHKQVTNCTVVPQENPSPDLAHSIATSQDPVTGRAQETSHGGDGT